MTQLPAPDWLVGSEPEPVLLAQSKEHGGADGEGQA